MESIIFKTLLHSLWQGVILAVLTALIVLFTTKSNAKLRYNLFVGSLLLFVFGVGVTFLIELNSFNAVAAVKALGKSEERIVITDPIISNAVVNAAFFDHLIGYLGKYSSSIVLVWFLIICAKSIRFMVDIRTLFQIRTKMVYQAGAFLEEKVSLLAAQYGIKEKVKILQSGMIQVPMVLGHFKPLILVPLGLINGLSAEQVDAILSHELAHIKRRDYLINVLQSVVEILFFFNPAVLWVSNMIKTERENCCDDLAVSGTRTKIDYIKALVSCQEFANEVPAYAMAVTGGKKHLVNRVQRLISSRNQSLNNMEKAIIGITLISSVIISSSFSEQPILKNAFAAVKVNSKTRKDAAQNNSAGFENEKLPAQNIKQDTSSKKKIDKRLKEIQLKEAQLAKEKAELKELSEIDSREERRNRGEAIYHQLIAEGIVKHNVNVSLKLDDDQFVINGVKQPDALFKRYRSKYIQFGSNSYSYAITNDENTNQNLNNEIDASIKANINAARAQQNAVRAQSQVVANANRAQSQAVADAKRVRAQAIADSQRAKIQSEVIIARAEQQAENARAQAEKGRIQAEKNRVEAQKGNTMTNELIGEGLIRNKGNFSYSLNKEALIINGQEQSGALHKKYAKKYLKTANQTITTSVSSD